MGAAPDVNREPPLVEGRETPHADRPRELDTMRTPRSRAALFAAGAAALTLSVSCSEPGATSADAGVRPSAASSSPGNTNTSTQPPARTPVAPVAKPTASAAPPAAKSMKNAKAVPGRSAGAPKTQAIVLNSLPGSSAARCAIVGNARDVRAGGLAGGNFAEMRTQYAKQARTKAQPEVSMYVIPQTVGSLKGVSVTVAPVRAKGATRTYTSSAAETAGDWRYYRVNMTIPSPGSWRISATSGSDKGCFQISFGR